MSTVLVALSIFLSIARIYRHCIGVNAAGDASPAIFGQPGTKCLISSPKFVKIVIKLPAEMMRTVQPSFAIQARHRGSQRQSTIVLTLHEL